MPDISYYQITTYKVLLSRTNVYVAGKERSRLALILCSGANVSTDIIRHVVINIMEDENDVPPNETMKVGDQYFIKLFYKASCYAWFIDLLRNEEPIWVTYSPTDPSSRRKDPWISSSRGWMRSRSASTAIPGRHSSG